MSGADDGNVAGDWNAEDLEHVECCPVCHGHGSLELSGLADNFHRTAPGRWDLWKCEVCSCRYINPRPSRKSIGIIYDNYPTHNLAEGDNEIFAHRVKLRSRVRRAVLFGELNRSSGYHLEPSSRLLSRLAQCTIRSGQ